LLVSGTTGGEYKLDVPLGAGPIRTDEAAKAYRRVLLSVGASLRRDAVDLRVVADVANRTGAIIDSQTAVGGWPVLAAAPPPVDSDRDGMPDEWETNRGLDPSSPDDGRIDVDGNGFTELEDYTDQLVTDLY
jgi:hypothetical protein